MIVLQAIITFSFHINLQFVSNSRINRIYWENVQQLPEHFPECICLCTDYIDMNGFQYSQFRCLLLSKGSNFSTIWCVQNFCQYEIKDRIIAVKYFLSDMKSPGKNYPGFFILYPVLIFFYIHLKK